jgi:hypothetical protein
MNTGGLVAEHGHVVRRHGLGFRTVARERQRVVPPVWLPAEEAMPAADEAAAFIEPARLRLELRPRAEMPLADPADGVARFLPELRQHPLRERKTLPPLLQQSFELFHRLAVGGVFSQVLPLAGIGVMVVEFGACFPVLPLRVAPAFGADAASEDPLA